MLSRVANSLYWLSRYLERAENFARLVEVNRYDSLDKTTLDPSVTEEDNWKPLLHATCLESSYFSEIEKSGNPDVGWFITFSDENNTNIIVLEEINEDKSEEIIKKNEIEDKNNQYIIEKIKNREKISNLIYLWLFLDIIIIALSLVFFLTSVSDKFLNMNDVEYNLISIYNDNLEKINDFMLDYIDIDYILVEKINIQKRINLIGME